MCVCVWFSVRVNVMGENSCMSLLCTRLEYERLMRMSFMPKGVMLAVILVLYSTGSIHFAITIMESLTQLNPWLFFTQILNFFSMKRHGGRKKEKEKEAKSDLGAKSSISISIHSPLPPKSARRDNFVLLLSHCKINLREIFYNFISKTMPSMLSIPFPLSHTLPQSSKT